MGKIRSAISPYSNYLRHLLRVLKLELRWALRHTRKKSHNLSSPLIISLTSHPPRYGTLARTLKSLLTQSIGFESVVLWLGGDDFDKLPRSVLNLQASGLVINTCNDIRSYNKLYHSLLRYPDHHIITADDDVYYWRTWAEEIASIRRNPDEILAHRCHLIRISANGTPLPYDMWEQEITTPACSPLVFPTGNGGILYPPRCFGDEFFDVEAIRSLAPTADDVWIYWMGRRAGFKFRQISGRRKFWNWSDSQSVSLMHVNLGVGSGNDSQISRMGQKYGWPFR